MTYDKKYSDAYKRAAKKYRRETVDSFSISTPKGQKAKLKALADTKGLSVNALVNQIINYTLTHPEILE